MPLFYETKTDSRGKRMTWLRARDIDFITGSERGPTSVHAQGDLILTVIGTPAEISKLIEQEEKNDNPRT